MHRLRAFIVEDETNNRDMLVDLLDQNCRSVIQVSGTSGSVKETSIYLKQHPVDLLFLDIELADGQVFDLLKDIDYKKYKLIFTTCYSEHAIKAIRFSAVDYLLKPIVPTELLAAVNRAMENDRLDSAVLGDIISRKKFELTDYLVVNNLYGIEKIPVDKIAYLHADGIYTAIYHEGGKTVSCKPIGTYEGVLPARMFNRCHKSFIVNKHCIKRVVKGRRPLLTLMDGTELPVAVRKREEFHYWFKE